VLAGVQSGLVIATWVAAKVKGLVLALPTITISLKAIPDSRSAYAPYFPGRPNDRLVVFLKEFDPLAMDSPMARK
jgi:hypothetical protein